MILDTSITLHRCGSGRCLVLLHCLGVDRHFWDFVAPLSRELTLVSYDLPGHGETPVPNGPYSIEDLAAQLAGLLKRTSGLPEAAYTDMVTAADCCRSAWSSVATA